MKNLKFLIFLGIFVFVFISCEKDDDNEEVKKSTLEACIEMTTVESNVGESINFVSCSKDADSFLWDFGDNETSTEENPSHVYTSAGDFTFTLKISSGEDTDEISGQIKILVKEKEEIIITGDINTQSTTWTADNIYVIENEVSITEYRILTIMPGTIIKFKEGSKLIVYGQIEANGTSENQITFTSYKEEPSKGDWDYIKFAGESTNSLKYCNILYAGGYGSNSASILLNYGNLKMENCLIEHSASSGIIIDNSSNGFQSFVRNTIKNCDSYDIEIFPNYVHMLGEQNVMENNGILIKAGNFSQNDETWKKQTVPYLIDEYVSISGTLRIQEGTTIAFKEYAYLSVGKDYYPGELIAKGTSSEKIIFTSAMDEKNEGDWGDIKFLNAGNSVLKNCIIEYGGGDTESMINTSPTSEYAIENTLLTIENCIIQYSESDGISFNPYLGFDKFRNNTIENITGYAINICPDYVSTIGSGNIINNKGILINTENIYNISSLWLKQDCPYIIDGDLKVFAFLEIEAGTTIAFTKNSVMHIGGSYDIGKLTALGTASEKIIFTSNEMEKERGDFVGLKFSNLASNSALDHCIVEYGGSVKGNIVMDTGFMSVSNSIIKYSDNYGIYIYESYMDPTLEDNTFQYNVSGDIFYGN